MREDAKTRGRLLLAEGRLRVLDVDEYGGSATAECRSNSGAVYTLGRSEETGWFCSCPAKTRCAHLVALQLVVVLEPLEARAWEAA